MCLITNSQQHDTDVTDTRIAVFSFVTESIQDTRHVIHPSRNKKPVSDKGAPEFISRKSI